MAPAGMRAEWPTWSPDGKRLAFVGGADSRSELYIISAGGHGLRRLTHNNVSDGTPAWSPSGRTILFSRKRGAGGGHQLMLVSPTGTGVRALPLHGGEPAWSPDGEHIAWARAVKGAREETDNIWIADSDGSTRQLTHEHVGVASHHPTWSPDGRTIAFMRSPPAAAGKGASIWPIGANGTGLRQVTHARFEDADPDW